jgi:hypothetical protein
MRSPPVVLRTATLSVALPPPATIGVTLPKPEPVIGVAWPRVRATQAKNSFARPAVIVLPARPQGMQRPGKVLRIWSPPPRRAGTG